MATPTAIVAYLALFVGVAGLFLFVNLLVGRFLRPNLPNEEKLEVYECGEPVIGSSFVQFDLRFYVVALLFIIFDVEVSLFFPWATVFGKATDLSSPAVAAVATETVEAGGASVLTTAAVLRLEELGYATEQALAHATNAAEVEALREGAQRLALASMADIGVFFAVLMVGFAYVWRRGDLDWVRSTTSQRGEMIDRTPPRTSTGSAKSPGSILVRES